PPGDGPRLAGGRPGLALRPPDARRRPLRGHALLPARAAAQGDGWFRGAVARRWIWTAQRRAPRPGTRRDGRAGPLRSAPGAEGGAAEGDQAPEGGAAPGPARAGRPPREGAPGADSPAPFRVQLRRRNGSASGDSRLRVRPARTR